MKKNKIIIYALLFLLMFGSISQVVAQKGKNYAVVIGVDTYNDSQIKGPGTAVNDAVEIGKILKSKLNFDVTLLTGKDALRSKIIDTVKNFSNKLNNDDKLLIFFSGKSEVEPLYGYGWWLPYDALYGDTMSYIDFVNVSDIINKINSDVLIITNENLPPDFASSLVDQSSKGSDEGIAKFVITSKNKKAVRSSKNSKLSVLGYSFIKAVNSDKDKKLSGLKLVELMNNISASDNVSLDFKYLSASSNKKGDFILSDSSSGAIKKDKSTKKDAEEKKDEPEKIVEKEKFAFLLVKTKPDNADFYLNDQKSALGKMKLKPGPFKVKVEKEGYKTKFIDLILKDEENKELYVKLEKLPPKKGWLKVEVDPAKANITFKNTAIKYKDNIKLLPGSYELLLKASFYKEKSVKVQIGEGEGQIIKEKLSLVDKYVNSIGTSFVKINQGRFKMGTPDKELRREKDEILHEVVLDENFFIMSKEVSVKEWKTFVKESGYKPTSYSLGGSEVWIGFRWEKDNDYSWKSPGFNQDDLEPVTCISYKDAVEYAKWLSDKEGLNYSLPTEAQWEYSCRTGNNNSFSYGNCLLDTQANFAANSKRGDCPEGQYRGKPIKTGTLQPNSWGLFDMHGNVMEWCLDWYGPYSSSKQVNPKGTDTGEYRVLRGGSWETDVNSCRTGNRFKMKPVTSRNNIGFRLVLVP